MSMVSVFKLHKFSLGQRRKGARVQEASADAPQTARLHPVYASLAKAMKQTPYAIALSDQMSPPVIHRILVRDHKILVEASDNVMVAKVQVQILDEHGNIVEKGEGIRVQGDWWEYVPERSGKTIIAAAWDLAGNVTQVEL